MAPPSSLPPSSTRYSIIVDAGSSGSRLQIYSWSDPVVERERVVREVRRQTRQEEADREEANGKAKVKGKTKAKGKGDGNGKVTKQEMDRRVEIALNRLVKVGKGVDGEDWMKKVEPGISTQTPSSIPKYLSPLLRHALQHIPPSHHSTTSLHILSTAGMRLLPPSESQAILESVCQTVLKKYPFMVGGDMHECLKENVRVIEGEEEGLWGWVAVNYLMDGFGHEPSSSSSSSSSSSLLESDSSSPSSLSSSSTPSLIPSTSTYHPTFGFLDMGGASTQLSFSPSPYELSKSSFPEDQLARIGLRLLNGQMREWNVYSKSWLGFGTNRSRERYLDGLLESWREGISGGESSSSNAITTIPSSSSSSPSPFDPIPDPCLPKNLLLPSSSPKTPSLIGTGDFSTCLQSLTPLLEREKECDGELYGSCLFGGMGAPWIDWEERGGGGRAIADDDDDDGKDGLSSSGLGENGGHGKEKGRGFIGVSEYWYTSEQVLGVGGVWDWGEWERGMVEFCESDWGDIEGEYLKVHKGEEETNVNAKEGKNDTSLDGKRKKYSKSVELSRLEHQCFKGAWISQVLHEGIGIPRYGLDSGGNSSLLDTVQGGLNEQAEKKAREKGLFEHEHHHGSTTIGLGRNGNGNGNGNGKEKPTHFQSMDHIGDTAISWTLGKIVIEASKSVDAYGHDVGKTIGVQEMMGNGRSRWANMLGLDRLQDQLDRRGISTRLVGFGSMGLVLLLLVWVCRKRSILGRRRRNMMGFNRRRKMSDVTGLREDGNITGQWNQTSSDEDPESVSESLSASTSRRTSITSVTAGMDRLNSFGSKYLSPLFITTKQLSNSKYLSTKSKITPQHPTFESNTFVLNPIEIREPSYTSAINVSQPPSPQYERRNFFIPAQSQQSSDSYSPGSPLPNMNNELLTPRTAEGGFPSRDDLTSPHRSSPIRAGLSRKSSTATLRGKRPQPLTGLATPMASTANSGGWNDPPVSGFVNSTNESSTTPEAGSLASSVLLQPLTSGGVDSGLSRNSSRMNLVEYGTGSAGLNSRPMSRTSMSRDEDFL